MYCTAVYWTVLTCTWFSPGGTDRCQGEAAAVHVYCIAVYGTVQCSHLVTQTGVKMKQLLYLAVPKCTVLQSNELVH